MSKYLAETLRCILYCFLVNLLINFNCFAEDASIDTIFYKLIKNRPMKIIGWEQLQGGRKTIPSSTELVSAMAIMDISALSRIINENTDYECIAGGAFMVIFPKDDALKHDVALSKRETVIKTITKLLPDQALDQAESANPTAYGVFLGGPLAYGPFIREGSISLKAGKYKCYELLNEVAKQANAKCWIMVHLQLNDPKTSKPISPQKLGAGSVCFF